MRRFVRYLLSGVLLGCCLLAGTPAMSDENPQLKAMIRELEEKIADADKRMIAHPSFIQELKALAEKYRSQLRELFFRETFEDGNFSENPKWMVKSGTFTVSPDHTLTSRVALPETAATAAGTKAQDKSLEQEAVGIILDSIFGGPKKTDSQAGKTSPQPSAPAAKAEPAVIFTKQTFPPAFELKLRFSASSEGQMDILLLGTSSLSPRYRLRFRADHSQAAPMEIVREGSSRSFVVGASDQFPMVGDKKFHTLTWVRLTNGEMNVTIDDTLVLQTYEVYYRDNFTGLGLANNQGDFSWDTIEVFKALPPAEK